MSWFFNAAYFVFGVFYSPIFLQKIKQAPDSRALIQQRLGKFPQEWKKLFSGKRTVWLHAVSVGEVMAVKRFAEDFLRAQPDVHLLLTTVTPTGQKIAKELEGGRVTVTYFPFDFSSACRRFFETFQPQVLLLAETEIWPNLLIQAKKFHVPVGILNARLSEKSAKRYARWNFVFRPLFLSLDFVLAQTETDASRFRDLGVSQERILVTGNMKFDNISLNPPDDRAVVSLKQEWGFKVSDAVWIAGSTHPKEEDTVIRAFCHLREAFPALKLVVAPRHIERSEQIASQIRKLGLKTVLATEKSSDEDFDVLVLNQLGTLKHLYQIADVVYVGGSLIKRGGQNPIEPASYRKPIVHGPYIFNFEKIYRDLNQEGGALMVRDEAQLIFAVRRLLLHEPERRDVGQRAFEKIRSFQGATQRHLEWVSKFLMGRSQERNTHEQVHTKLFPSAGRGL